MKFTGLIFLCGCLFLFGCKSDPAAAPAAPPKVATSPKSTAKLKMTDVVIGKSKRKVAKGDTVWVLYTGTLNDGKVFDTNMSSDKDPLSFTLGQGAVIKGWDQGLIGMRIGGERKLFVPSDLAYGANGNTTIPPNADLNFDIKLLGLVKVGQENVIDCTDDKVGAGPEAKTGSQVTISYVGTLLNGKVFEDSKTFGKPFTFTIGTDPMLTCIEEGVRGMKVGGIRTIISPPATSYVNRQQKDVPQNSEVVFKVTLISMK